MNTPEDDPKTDLLWRLTADQRRQVYEEEKRRIEQAASTFSNKTKTLIGVYLFGCVLIYFGITESIVEFWQKRQWVNKPGADIVPLLVNAVVELSRPFLAVVSTFWFGVATLLSTWFHGIPVGIILLLLFIFNDRLLQFIRRLVKRDE